MAISGSLFPRPPLITILNKCPKLCPPPAVITVPDSGLHHTSLESGITVQVQHKELMPQLDGMYVTHWCPHGRRQPLFCPGFHSQLYPHFCSQSYQWSPEAWQNLLFLSNRPARIHRAHSGSCFLCPKIGNPISFLSFSILLKYS